MSDFFTTAFPSDTIKVEARTLARKSLLAPPPAAGSCNGGTRCDTFTDEFKATVCRDLASGAMSTEVKSTSNFAICKSRFRTPSSPSAR